MIFLQWDLRGVGFTGCYGLDGHMRMDMDMIGSGNCIFFHSSMRLLHVESLSIYGLYQIFHCIFVRVLFIHVSMTVRGAFGSTFPPCPHCVGEIFQYVDGSVPVYTGVCDADALFQGFGTFGGDLLAAFVDVGFDHDAYDAGFPGPDLRGDG